MALSTILDLERAFVDRYVVDVYDDDVLTEAIREHSVYLRIGGLQSHGYALSPEGVQRVWDAIYPGVDLPFDDPTRDGVDWALTRHYPLHEGGPDCGCHDCASLHDCPGEVTETGYGDLLCSECLWVG